MMSISELKKSAKDSLNGYWRIMAISYLIYTVFKLIVGLIPIPIINYILSLYITISTYKNDLNSIML